MQNISNIKTPYYIVDEAAVEQNLRILKYVSDTAGCKILLAQKAFSMFSMYPIISKYLCGTTASGLYEARLGHEEMKKENHIFSPAYSTEEFDEIAGLCDHIVFNSMRQWEKFGTAALKEGKSCGLRINPECSTQEHGIYDPCGEFSRLGITLKNMPEVLPNGIEGLHFHTLCEQNADALKLTLDAVIEKFGKYLKNIKWLNFGGGHHITRADYDINLLIACIQRVKREYGVEVYIEPGEAVVLNCGYLVSRVMEIVENGMKIAILDTSAACHMPDVIEMPYRPEVVGAGKPNEKKYTYRFGGPTCLAGDIIGDYSFDMPLAEGDYVTFCDMALYSMVKNNTFNGIALPSIAIKKTDGTVVLQKSFGYESFKNRLS